MYNLGDNLAATPALPMASERPAAAASTRVLGMRVDATSYKHAVDSILAWARAGESRVVCEAPVHMVMETRADAAYRQNLETADLVTPGGMPIVWMLRALGFSKQPRVYGPQLMLHTCAAAAGAGIPVGLYGSTPAVIEALRLTLKNRFPDLKIVFATSPPFRSLTSEEEAATRRAMTNSGCRILFVGLGCPRQEKWMARQRDFIPSVMLGVGAAFDFISGNKPQAPRSLQNFGLEWVFRFATEPRRLWRRYLYHNPRFMALATHQLIRHKMIPEKNL